MNRAVSQLTVLISLLAFLCYAETSSQCEPHYFACPDGSCIYYNKRCDGKNDCGDNADEHFCNPYNCLPTYFLCLNQVCISTSKWCDRYDHCGDNSDERYCNIHSSDTCPPDWFRCPNGKRCIPFLWMCNGRTECNDISEETEYCEDGIFMKPIITPAKSSPNAVLSPRNSVVSLPPYIDPDESMNSWFLKRKNPWLGRDSWGSHVHRIAVALHLADESTFSPGNSTGEDIRYELEMQLYRIRKDKNISSQELALYIHALLVACLDPRDFYGGNLVQELRSRVEASGNYTNPFLILALCNAGDNMTSRDLDRVTAAYDTQYRPFWTDYEALACMALSCISANSVAAVDEQILTDMLQELKKRQLTNGTVDNFKTTALVTQALFIHDSYKSDFNLVKAMKVLSDRMKGSHSHLDSYYALPTLNRKSLLNVNSGHCRKEPDAKEKDIQIMPNVNSETIIVFFSVLVGEESNGGRTWRLRLLVNSTVYDAIETLVKMDISQNVEYNMVDGKPYVTALNGKEDDPEMGKFWFVYLKIINSDEDPKIVEESPVDVTLQSNQEIILWYKRAPWSAQSQLQKSDTPS